MGRHRLQRRPVRLHPPGPERRARGGRAALHAPAVAPGGRARHPRRRPRRVALVPARGGVPRARQGGVPLRRALRRRHLARAPDARLRRVRRLVDARHRPGRARRDAVQARLAQREEPRLPRLALGEPLPREDHRHDRHRKRLHEDRADRRGDHRRTRTRRFAGHPRPRHAEAQALGRHAGGTCFSRRERRDRRA